MGLPTHALQALPSPPLPSLTGLTVQGAELVVLQEEGAELAGHGQGQRPQAGQAVVAQQEGVQRGEQTVTRGAAQGPHLSERVGFTLPQVLSAQCSVLGSGQTRAPRLRASAVCRE